MTENTDISAWSPEDLIKLIVGSLLTNGPRPCPGSVITKRLHQTEGRDVCLRCLADHFMNYERPWVALAATIGLHECWQGQRECALASPGPDFLGLPAERGVFLNPETAALYARVQASARATVTFGPERVPCAFGGTLNDFPVELRFGHEFDPAHLAKLVRLVDRMVEAGVIFSPATWERIEAMRRGSR